MTYKPYLLFAGDKPAGGAADFVSDHFTQDEALAALHALGNPAWWQVAVLTEEGMKVVLKSGADFEEDDE